MAVLLDTATLAPSERHEAVDAAMRYATVPSRVTIEDPPGDIHSRFDFWDLGHASLLRQVGSSMRITRTAKELALAAPERVSLSLLSRGQWDYTQHGHSWRVESARAEFVLTDLTATTDYNRIGKGGSHSFLVDMEALTMPVDVVRSAAPRLTSSPLYELVREHISRLDGIIDTLDRPARTMLGSATIELVRALIATAAGDVPRQRAALDDSLPTRISIYVQRHLTDPDLSPVRIAREHNISVRHLYNTWSTGELSISQWIIVQRLEAARRELARPAAQRQTIAAIARRCGFTDATHFSRRFREAYGMSPREWRDLKQSEGHDSGV